MTSYFLSENKQSIQEEEKEIPARLISWKHRDQAFEIKVSHSCHDTMGQPTGSIAAISFLDNPSPWYLAWLQFNSLDVIRPYSVEILSRLPKFTSLGGVKSGINSIYNVPLRLHAVVSQDQQIDSEEAEAEDEASMNIQDEGAKAQSRDEEKTKDKRRKRKQQQQPRGRIILYMCMLKGTEYFESSPIAEQGETISETVEPVESEQGEALRLSIDIDEETFTSSTEYSTVVETWQIQRGRNNKDDDDADTATTTSGKDEAKSKRGARRIYADGGVRFVQASTNLADTLPSSLDDLTNVLSQSDQYMDNYVNLWRGPERRGLVPNSAVASFGSYVTAMSPTTTLGDLQWNFGPRSGTNVFERKEFFKGQTGSGAFNHERGQVFCMPNALFLVVEKGRIGAGVFAERQVYIQLPGVASGVRQVNKPATLINNVYVSNNNKYGTPTSLYGGKILDIWHDSERLYVYELCAKGLVQAPFPAAAKDDSIVLGLQSYTTSGRLALRPTIFKPVPVSLTSAAAIVQIFQLGHYTDEQIMSMTNSLFWFWTWSLIQDPERTKYVDSLQEKNIFKFWDVTQVKQNLCASWSAWMTHLLGSFGGFQSSPAPGTAVISSTSNATTVATADKRAQDIEAKTGNQARKKYAILQNALSSAEMAKQLQTLKVAGPTSARYQVTVSMEALEQMLDLVQLSEIKDLVHQLCTFPLGQAREWYKRAMATARGETQMLDLTDMIQNTGPLQCIALTAADLADVLGMPDSLMVAETLDRILVHVPLPGLSGLSSIKKIEQDQAPKQQRLFVSELVTLFVRALVANHVRMETAISRSSARDATAVVPGFPGFTLATKINKAESKETKENTRDVQKGISITITMAGETDQTVWITNLDKFIDKLVDQILVLLHVTIGKNEQGAEPIRDGRIISIGQNTFYDVASATAMANITDADPTVLKNNRRPWWIFSRASMREQVSKMILSNVTNKGSIGGGSGIGGASAGTSTGAAGTTVLSVTPNAATRTLTLRLASNRDELPQDAYFDSATVVSRSTTVDAQVRETSRSIHRVLFERTSDPKIYKDTNTVFFDAVSKFFSSKESFTTLENRYERVMSGLLYLANSLDIVSSVSSASATTSLSLSSASNSSISSSFPFNTSSSIDVCIWPDGTTRKFPEAAQNLGMQRLLRVSNVESERENEIFHVHCTRFKSRNRPWNLGDAETETALSWSVAQKDQETDKDKRLSKTYWSTVSRIAEDFAKLSYGNSLSSASIPRLIIKDPEGSLATMVSESKQVTLARVAKLGLGETTDTVLWGRSSASGVSLGGSKSQQDAENQDQDEEQLGSGIFALVQQKYIQPIQPKAEPTMNQTLHFWMTSTLAQLLRAYKPTDPVMRFDTPREMLKGAILTVLRTRFRVNQNAAHIDKSVKQVRANITASKNRLRLKRQNERDKNKIKSESSSLGLDLDETRNKMDLRDDQEDEEKDKDQDEETKTEQKRTRTLKGRQARKPARKGFFHEILIKNYFRVLGQDEQTKSTHRSTSKGRDPTSSELIHLLLRWGIFHVALEGLVALMDVELLDLQDPDQIDELKQKQVEAQQEYQDAIASVKDAETARNAVEADKNSFKKLFTERGQSSNTGRKNNRFKQDIGSGSSSAAMADVWELRFRPSEPIEKRQSIARVILSTGNKDAMINDLAVAALDAMPPGSVPDDLAALAQEWKTKRASIGSGSGSASSVSNISKNSQEQDNDNDDIVMNTIPPLESGSVSGSIADQVQVKEETEETKDAMTDIAKEEDKGGDDEKGDDTEKKRVKNTEQKPKGRRGAPVKSEAEKAETKQRRLELTKLLATLKTKEAKEEAKAKFKQNRAEEMAKKKAQAKAKKDEAKTKAKKESKKLSSASASATKVKKEPKVTKRKRVSTKKSSTDDDNDGGGDKKIPTSSEETLKPAKKRGRKAGGFNTVSTRAREEHKNVLVSKNEDLYKAYLIAHELGMEWYRASARVPGTAIHKTLVQWRRNLSNQLNQDRSSNLNHLQTRTFKLFNTLSSGITFPVPGEVARSQDWYSPWYHMYHLENTATGSGFDCLWSLMPSDDDLRKMVPDQFAERLCTPWSLNQYMTDGKGVIKKIQDGHGLYTTDIENARYYKDMIAMGIRAMYKPVSVAASTSGGKKPPSSVTDEIKSFASTVTIAAIDASPLALAFVERNIFLKARAISAPELIHKGSGSSSTITKTSQKSATRELPLYFPVSYFWLLNSHSNRGAPKKDLKGSRSPPFDVPHNGATRETESKFLVPANARMDYPGRESLVANLVFHGIISDKQGHEDYPFLGFPRVVNPWIGQQEIPLHALRRLVRMMVIVRLMHPNGQVASTPLDWLSALGNMMGTYDPKPFLYTDFKEIGKNGEDISGLARQPLRAHTRASDRSNPFPGGYAFYFYDALLAVYRHVQLVFEQLYQDRDQNPRRSDTAPKLFEPPLGTPKPKLPTLKSLADKANDVLLDSVASETNNGALTALKQAYAFFIKSKDECEAWFREADIAFRKRQVARFDAMIKESTTETKIASHQKAKEHQQVKLAEAIKKAASEKKNFILKHGYAPQSTMNPSFLNQSSARQRQQQQQRDEASTLTATAASASSSLLSLAQGEEAQEFDVDDFVNEGIEQEQQDKRKKQGTRDTNKEEEEVKEEPRGKKSKQDEQDTKAQKGSNNNKGNRAHAFAYMAQGGSSSDSRETRASDFFKYQVLRELCAVAKQQNRIPATPLNALVSRVYSAGRLFVYVGMFYDRLLTNEAWGKMVDKYFIPGIDAGNQASTDDKFLPEPVPDYGNVAKKQPRHHLQIREILIKKKSKKGIRKEEANKAKEAKKEAKKTLAQKDKASKQGQTNASSNPSAVLPVESSTVDQETQDVDMKHNIFAEPPRLVSVSDRAPAASDVSSVLSISTPTPVAVGIPSTPTVPERKIIAARTLAPSVAVSASSAVPMASATPIVKPSLALTSPLAVLPRPAPPIPRSKAKIIPATKQRRSLIDASLDRMSE